eukprot:TRINITY_DN41599_c0_g1_i3.p1 TRINITY_DN41599_c0_g1~~TRINITY_DN41599_c0_g1_i3.p1  ORF type:complete len:383 (+),score=61.03 TRINITY_DN41599_c0_g1_i3:1196-2344(+)
MLSGHRAHLSEEDVESFYEHVRSHPAVAEVLADVDAVLCTLPASMCELWLPFNKTIIIVSGGGYYNLGRCSAAERQRFDDHLQMLAAAPPHVVAANNHLDAEVIETYSGVRPVVLESVPWLYLHEVRWEPRRPEILVFCNRKKPKMCPQLAGELNRMAEGGQFAGLFRDIYDLYPHYSLEDLAAHPGVVVFPYMHMTWTVAELFALSIPMFLPSIRWLTSIASCPDHRSAADAQQSCKLYDTLLPQYVNEVRAFCPEEDPAAPLRAESTGRGNYKHRFLPEDESSGAWAYWMQYIEFYRWPTVTTFEDMPDLLDKLASADLNATHRQMRAVNEGRARRMRQKWCDIVRSLPKKSSTTSASMPPYKQALRQLWGVDELMARRK